MQGCLNGTSMACSPDGSLFATGSNSGVVNLYSRQQQEAQRRQGQHTVFGEEAAAGSWAMPEAPIAGGPFRVAEVAEGLRVTSGSMLQC